MLENPDKKMQYNYLKKRTIKLGGMETNILR